MGTGGTASTTSTASGEDYLTLRAAASDMHVSYERARKLATAHRMPAEQLNNGRWRVPVARYRTWRQEHPEAAYVRADMVPEPDGETKRAVTHLKRRANALEYHATHDATEHTKPARAGLEARFAQAVDPDGTLRQENPRDFYRRLTLYKSAYFTKLRLQRTTGAPSAKTSGVSTAPATATHATPTQACTWCWRREHPRQRFPRAWVSVLCSEHAQELALKEAVRRFDLRQLDQMNQFDQFDEAS